MDSGAWVRFPLPMQFVAQWVEQRTHNSSVAGSIPAKSQNWCESTLLRSEKFPRCGENSDKTAQARLLSFHHGNELKTCARYDSINASNVTLCYCRYLDAISKQAVLQSKALLKLLLDGKPVARSLGTSSRLTTNN